MGAKILGWNRNGRGKGVSKKKKKGRARLESQAKQGLRKAQD